MCFRKKQPVITLKFIHDDQIGLQHRNTDFRHHSAHKTQRCSRVIIFFAPFFACVFIAFPIDDETAAERCGVRAVLLDSPAEVTPELLAGVRKIGLSATASTPESQIAALKKALENN